MLSEGGNEWAEDCKAIAHKCVFGKCMGLIDLYSPPGLPGSDPPCIPQASPPPLASGQIWPMGSTSGRQEGGGEWGWGISSCSLLISLPCSVAGDFNSCPGGTSSSAISNNISLLALSELGWSCPAVASTWLPQNPFGVLSPCPHSCTETS